METVSISRFKASCLSLLKKVQRTGQPLLITKRGEPIAQVVPAPPSEKKVKWLGSLSDSGTIVGDIVSPLPEDEWEVLRS